MPADPKKKRIKLNAPSYQELRKEAYNRAQGHCESCYRWCPVSEGHLHHVISRGSGGGDVIDNVLWLCYLCHDKKHRGL